MKKLALATALTLCAAPMAHADRLLGVFAGAGTWATDYSGEAGDPSITLNDLGVKSNNNNFYYIALEHPIPLLPNVRLERTNISNKESAVIHKTFNINGTDFSANQKVDSAFDLSHTDATLYYQILDNWISLDVGLTARKFDGFVSATSPSVSERVKIDQTLPLVFGKLQFDLPFTGLSAGVEGNYISLNKDKLSDYRAKISYLFDTVVDVGVEAGYRTMNLKVDDSDITGDLKFKGSYVALIAHF